VRGDDGAGAQLHGDDLALGGPDLHAPSSGAWVQRVVVGVEAQIGLLGHPHDEAAVDVGHALG
jgi:hypothetical protein